MAMRPIGVHPPSPDVSASWQDVKGHGPATPSRRHGVTLRAFEDGSGTAWKKSHLVPPETDRRDSVGVVTPTDIA